MNRPPNRAGWLFLVAFLVAGCTLPWSGFFQSSSPTPVETPTPSPTPTVMSTVDAFKARVADPAFQAQGPVTGTLTAATFLGTRTSDVTGSFKVHGGDSAYSITSSIFGITEAIDYVVVGDTAYSRTNGGQWTSSPASGRTVQSLVADTDLSDAGIETKFGRQLHHLVVTNPAGLDLTPFGIAPGSRQNLSVGLSFWAEEDGTPAGLTIQASFDQKILGTTAHLTANLDVQIESFSGVTITPPAG